MSLVEIKTPYPVDGDFAVDITQIEFVSVDTSTEITKRWLRSDITKQRHNIVIKFKGDDSCLRIHCMHAHSALDRYNKIVKEMELTND